MCSSSRSSDSFTDHHSAKILCFSHSNYLIPTTDNVLNAFALTNQSFKCSKTHPSLPQHPELPFFFGATNCHEGVTGMAAEGRSPGWQTPSSLTMNWVLSLDTRIWVVWLPISTWFKRNILYTIFFTFYPLSYGLTPWTIISKPIVHHPSVLDHQFFSNTMCRVLIYQFLF